MLDKVISEKETLPWGLHQDQDLFFILKKYKFSSTRNDMVMSVLSDLTIYLPT